MMLAYFVGLGPLAEYVSLSRRRKGGGSERDFWTACRHFSAFHAIPQGALQLYFILLSMSSASRAGVAVLARKLRWDVADGVARAYDAGPVPVDLLE